MLGRGALTPEEHLDFWHEVQDKREARSKMLNAIQVMRLD